MIYQWEGLTERISIMQFDGNMTPNAAAIEAVKTMYPNDYSDILKLCNDMGLKPETEIPAFIDKLEAERKRQPRTVTQPAPRKPAISGFDKMAAYAQGTA